MRSSYCDRRLANCEFAVWSWKIFGIKNFDIWRSARKEPGHQDISQLSRHVSTDINYAARLQNPRPTTSTPANSQWQSTDELLEIFFSLLFTRLTKYSLQARTRPTPPPRRLPRALRYVAKDEADQRNPFGAYR